MVRFKNRYLLVETVWRDGAKNASFVSQRQLAECIKESVQTNFGDFGAAAMLQSLQGTWLHTISSSPLIDAVQSNTTVQTGTFLSSVCPETP
jgi:hypothetical protein